MNSEQFQVDVIVVGAGPTGLTMAHELMRLGVRCHIVDSSNGPTNKSKALAVQARSLEIFKIMGVVDQFFSVGFKTEGIRVSVAGKEVARGKLIGLADEGCRYSFILVVSQAETERILADSLHAMGIGIGWNTECVGLNEVGGEFPVVADFRRNDGSSYSVQSRFIVGCDGAHSFIRHQMPVKFEGGAYQQRFLLADAHVDWDQANNLLAVFLGKKGVCVYFPFGNVGSGRFILMDRRSESENPTDEHTIESEVQTYVRAPLRLSDFKWISPFKLHHRCASSYQKDPFFIAGDAAHIHSPAGGQGMNTGIQDSFNLAWKLAFAVRGHSSASLLQSYTVERRAVGVHLLKRTDRLFTAAASGNRLFCWARNVGVRLIAPIVFRSPRIRSVVFHFVSQLKIRYRRSPIVFDYSQDAPRHFIEGLPPGYRLPDARVVTEKAAEETHYLYDYLTGTRYVLLCFSPPNDPDFRKGLSELRSIVKGNVSVMFVINRETRWSGLDQLSLLVDRFGDMSRFFGTGSMPALFLVRPDAHIAVRVWGCNVTPIADYFRIVHGMV